MLRGFLGPFLEFSALLVGVVVVSPRLRTALRHGNLDPRMKLIAPALCVVVVINARVDVVVQLTGLWRQNKKTRHHRIIFYHPVKSQKEEDTNRVVVKACAVVVIHPGGFVKHEAGLCHGLLSSGSQHVGY